LESILYEQAIRDDELHQKNWAQMMHRATMMKTARNNNNTDDGQEVVVTNETYDNGCDNNLQPDAVQSIVDTYLREIDLLERACEEHREELLHLRSLQKEQVVISDELKVFAEYLASEGNALELEARAFDNDQEHLTRTLTSMHDEIDRLISSEIRLPSTLIQLHIDIERGLRYPLINELRLAYRPKGDVHWKEIQAAWALAAYLLLMVATLFEFQSQNWKIVPLSHCAKLIYRPSIVTESDKAKHEKHRVIVFNLGHPQTNGSKALLTLNALLCQLVQHVSKKVSLAVQNGILDPSEIQQIPFEVSATSVGGIVLLQLNEDDDSGWSQVIHFMASNLQWLSKCASICVFHQVAMLAPLTVVKPTVHEQQE
jgi:Apg6 BARA domain